jgi:CRISPR type IV-associated protein Csf2
MPEYRIVGILKLTSPLHVAAPGDRVIDLNSLLPSYGKGGLPLSGTIHYPLALSDAEILNEELENPHGRGLIFVPVFPANDVRGRLRRRGAEEVFKVLASRGELLTLETYHGMMCGAVTGQPSKELTFDLALKSGRHSFLGLFGGGPRLVSSCLQIHTLWPITNTTIKVGLVPPCYEDDKVSVRTNRLTQAIFYRRIDDALVFSDGRTELIVQEYSTAVGDWIRQLGSGERSKKQLHTFAAIEYVIPGTRFYSEIKVETERAGLGALGLLIHSVTAFANKQGIGGWIRNGFGRFESEFDLLTPDNVRVPLITKTDTGYEPNVDAEQVAEALDGWATASSTVSAAELEELYSLPPEKRRAAAR